MDSNTDPVATTDRIRNGGRDDGDDRRMRSEASGDETGGTQGVDERDEESTERVSRRSPETDRCDTCGTAIGPRDYRLSRVITEGPTTTASHYCSESCFPDADRSNRPPEPRDWSYCR